MIQPEDKIPEQETGFQSNTTAVQECATVEAAADFFTLVKNRLQQVSRWHDWAGAGTAQFWLTDAVGNEVSRPPLAGDHFKIDIPGPGSSTGDGFDWVRVEAVEEQEEEGSSSILIRVRPATNPQNNKQDVAHFFSEEATSNFVVKKEGNRVSASVYGRNEKPNTHAEAVGDKLRNTAVASGAVTAFSKLQWKALVNGLVKPEA